MCRSVFLYEHGSHNVVQFPRHHRDQHAHPRRPQEHSSEMASPGEICSVCPWRMSIALKLRPCILDLSQKWQNKNSEWKSEIALPFWYVWCYEIFESYGVSLVRGEKKIMKRFNNFPLLHSLLLDMYMQDMCNVCDRFRLPLLVTDLCCMLLFLPCFPCLY